MNDKKHAQPGHCSTIKWGAIIAGAAIVGGIMLFAPTVLPTIAGWVGGLFSSAATSAATAGTAAVAAGPSMATKFIEAITSEAAKKFAGAVMVGGGIAYFMSGKKEPHQSQANPEASESFAMKEDMRKMQALMVMRAAYAGNPEAQAMMQQGRA